VIWVSVIGGMSILTFDELGLAYVGTKLLLENGFLALSGGLCRWYILCSLPGDCPNRVRILEDPNVALDIQMTYDRHCK